MRCISSGGLPRSCTESLGGQEREVKAGTQMTQRSPALCPENRPEDRIQRPRELLSLWNFVSRPGNAAEGSVGPEELQMASGWSWEPAILGEPYS